MSIYRIPIAFSPGDSSGLDRNSPSGPPEDQDEGVSPEDELPEDQEEDDWEDEELDDEEDDWDEDAPIIPLDPDADDWDDDEDDVVLPAKFRQAFRPREELPRKRKDREE